MKIFLCFCFFCFSFSASAQQDSSKIENLARRDSIVNSRRDSIINSIGKELNVPKGKMENVLTAFAQAADKMIEVANNDELDFDEKSTQLRAIAEQRDATLKSLLNENQLTKIKGYIIRRKIPRKIQ